VSEEIDEKGETVEKKVLPKPKTLDFNVAHRLWGHKGKASLAKTAKNQNVTLKGTLSACEGCGLSMASQKAVSKTTNTKATKICERVFVDGTGPFNMTIAGNRYWYQVIDDMSRIGWTDFKSKKRKVP
jgi:Fe-S cluster biogenesis protein NfuA